MLGIYNKKKGMGMQIDNDVLMWAGGSIAAIVSWVWSRVIWVNHKSVQDLTTEVAKHDVELDALREQVPKLHEKLDRLIERELDK